MENWFMGIDTGGTFTDVVAIESQTGEMRTSKISSTPSDPSQSVMDGLAELGIAFKHIALFAHGTTVATNAILELKGAKTGLLITKGTRGVYEIQGRHRPTWPDNVDLFYQKPALLVPQKLTEEVTERVAYNGEVIVPLDENSVRLAVRRLKQNQVESIGVCYLFSFMNPTHEERTAEIIRQEYPGCRVSYSSRVLPVIREYPRLATLVLDAYVGPIIERYLQKLGNRLKGIRTGAVYLMQSNGGLMRVNIAANYPNQTLLSGPSAGVVFGAWTAQLAGERNVVTFDMGGTSTDISTIKNGEYAETTEGLVAGGHDIATPMFEINTLGAGGGTIAWIDGSRLLKVGPKSAGADPGPACYGLGGQEATITDADLVLGYLNPEYFLGGRIKLSTSLSEKAIEKLARSLGMDIYEAAAGMRKIVNVNMGVELRSVLVGKGYDPKSFALVAFGGAGPVHAAEVAKDLGIPRVIIPIHPGLACARGLLQTDVKHYYLRSRLKLLSHLPVDELNRLFKELEQRAIEDAKEEGFDRSMVELIKYLEMRYVNQGYELPVSCPGRELRDNDRPALRDQFDHIHEQTYGQRAQEEEVEIVCCRLTSLVRVPKFKPQEYPMKEKSPGRALKSQRRVFFEEARGFVDALIYEREKLESGNEIRGPAIIEELDSTTVVPPGQLARIDSFRNIIIEARGEYGS
jgi:N-methylhydantoinase A